MRMISLRNMRRGVAGILVALVIGLWGEAALAQSSYQPLEGIPGFEQETASGGFPAYVQSIYNFGIWTVGIAALFMLTVGGFMYLTSAGNTSTLGSAKGVIKDALIGLFLALFAWLILYVINPDLVNINLGSTDVSAPSSPTYSPPSGSYPTTGSWPDDSATRSALAGISFNHPTNCQSIGQDNCTSVYQLGQPAVSGLLDLKQKCNCDVVVTGGTEYWLHSKGTAHRPGNSTVDLRRSTILAYVQANGQKCGERSNGKDGLRPVYRLNGADYWDENDAHFHVSYTGGLCR
jgi:hypothetical protein